jgi:hypothetical protein
MTGSDFTPLDIFSEHYTVLKADYWRSMSVESKPKALARVLALAREYGKGNNWSQQIEGYLEDFRLALAAARSLPALDARTTAWRVAGPSFVRRMAGSYRLDLPRVHEGDFRSVVWFRLPDEVAADCWLEAQQRNCTTATVVAEIVRNHYRG